MRADKATYRAKVPIKDLTPYEENPRIMPREEMEALERSIREFGFVEPVVVDENNLIIGGHQRLAAATTVGLTEVPVMVVRGLSETEKMALNLALNKIHGLWDDVKLRNVLMEISVDLDIELAGFTEIDLRELQLDYDTFSAALDGLEVLHGKGHPGTVDITFNFEQADANAVKAYINKHSKPHLALQIIKLVRRKK